MHSLSQNHSLSTRVALFLGAIGVAGSLLVGLASYRASRALVLDSLLASDLSLARSLAAHVDHSANHGENDFLAHLEENWARRVGDSDGTHLCVVSSDGTLALHTLRPSQIGSYVGHVEIPSSSSAEAASVRELLESGDEWVGLNRTVGGERQLAAYARSSALRGLVVVHRTEAWLQARIWAKSLPWVLGLGVVTLVLLPLALWLLAWAIKREQSRTVGALDLLAESNARYQDLYEKAPDMFLSVETETGLILRCNRTFADRMQLPRPEIIGRSVLEFYDEGSHEDVERARGEFLRTGAVRNLKLRLRSGSGDVIDVSLNASAVRDGEGRILYSRSVLRDITEIKRAQAESRELTLQLRHSQRIEALGTLAGGIAHDFNNILMSIMGHAELARGEAHDKPEIEEYLGEILLASRRARELVARILAFARKQPTGRRPVNLANAVREAEAFLHATLPAPAEIALDLGSDDLFVLANPHEIHQVIVNLSVNAHQALEAGIGTVTLSLDRTVDSGGAEAGSESPVARLRVTDDGSGMPADVLERLFEPYFTTKEPGDGTGLGLSVVHGIVLGHGGEITVETEVGVGSTFEVRLPLALEHGEPAGHSDQSLRQPRHGSGRILIVDDEDSLNRLTARRLESLGYEVICLDSMESALELLTGRPTDISLLLTDQNLEHSTGTELVREIRDQGLDLPVIVATGSPQSISRRTQSELDITDVLSKPYGLEQLAEAVRTALDGSGSANRAGA